MYRLGPGLSTIAKIFFNTANFERLSRKGEESENFGKWFMHFGFVSIKQGINYSKIRCIFIQQKLAKKSWLFSLLQYFTPLIKSINIYDIENNVILRISFSVKTKLICKTSKCVYSTIKQYKIKFCCKIIVWFMRVVEIYLRGCTIEFVNLCILYNG